MTMSERPTRIDPTEAKQGKTGLGVRYVLIGGLALVIVIFIVLAFVLSRTS
jgi:hypothetical protein